MQNAARDVAIGGAAAAQKLAMTRKRGSQKNAKRVSSPSPPMQCKIILLLSKLQLFKRIWKAEIIYIKTAIPINNAS